MLTRRKFLKRSLDAGLLAVPVVSAAVSCSARAAERAVVLVNHVGFTPAAAKFCLVNGTRPVPFTVVKAGQVVRQGMMNASSGDLGDYLQGDFSDLSQPGSYQVVVSSIRSEVFTVSDAIYTDAIRRGVGYFAKQRCGDSHSGYHAPCHLDDGRRRDNGRHQDVTGGWHDACDVRKWVDATIYGMMGLSRVLDVLGKKQADAIVDELRWGNQYFLKMQEPDGYLMDYCGGDDGNYFTDNQIGTADDRPIHVDPCILPAQFHFIAAQAAMVRQTREADPDYARRCQESAHRCLHWCTTQRQPAAATSLGAAIIACVQWHRTTGEDRYQNLAVGYAASLLTLQTTKSTDPANEPSGFFLATPDRPDPAREIQHGNLPLLALCELLEQFPKHAQASLWRSALELHTHYLTTLSGRSVFGAIPFGLYVGNDPGGNRRIGSYWYRWFMKTHGEYAAADWWVGINAHLASHGVGLCKAARLLQSPTLRSLAQRQLDWILGLNPFNASTITGTGRNQPALYVTGQFRPATPLIAGGVMNGLGGSALDQPVLQPGSWNTCEYWTPMTAYTMWLMAELQTAGGKPR
jgi:hypothetical protein